MSNDDIEHYRNQITLARTEIKNLRQQISSLKYEHQNEIKLMKASISDLRCSSCIDSPPETPTLLENGLDQPSSSNSSDCIRYHPIGIIETSFQNKRGVPRQPTILNKAAGTVIINSNVFNNPEHALSGLEEFSHMWIIFHFHATESTNLAAKVSPPRLQGERRGVFSTRSPHRPCSIGLSLVKIQEIEGNKIHFLGVDMINGTPVLDIKPYIPQYDYPVPTFGDTPMTSLERPRTEGISDAAEAIVNLQVHDGDRVNPRLVQPIGIDTSSPLPRSPLEGDLPSPETHDVITPVSPSRDLSTIDLDGSYRISAMRRLDTERGAPDGQERFTPPQSTNFVNTTHDGIRVAPWIANPPSQRFQVHFTEDALVRLNELIGERASAFKTNIESLLSEDPRSNYVRSRYPDHEYSCVLEDVSISCMFNIESLTCTIVAVRSAEELQQDT